LPHLFTVGHSNRTLEDFVALLSAHGVRRVLDVRRYPQSRKWPHFDAGALSDSLPRAGIAYAGLPELGGRRRPRPDSRNTAWRNEAFRGYADFMESETFQEGLGRALEEARRDPSALLCAEALPWRCHRSMIADAALARGWTVADILSEKEAREHRLTSFARLEGPRVVYDGGVLPFPKTETEN
jgi:uncharacterized protein (DUF488 family)